MVKSFLVTTSIQETWPQDKKSIIFLGKWCFSYSGKEKLNNVDTKYTKYHWDDRNKLFNDYQYLSHLYEDLLISLSQKLNRIHSVDHSIRYWRILIGPWLGVFIQIVFDRWYMLSRAIENNNISNIILISNGTYDFTPNDMSDFYHNTKDDSWNEKIYSDLVELVWHDKLHIEKTKKVAEKIITKNKIGWKRKLIYYYNLIANKFNFFNDNNSEYFFHGAYLEHIKEFIIQIRLGQVPKFYFSPSIKEFNIDLKKRNWDLLEGTLHFSSFEDAVKKLIPVHLPKAYLEGYKDLNIMADKINWPKYPRLIFTSNSYFVDDLFKIWSAIKTQEQHTPLIIGQHGGNFGMSPFCFSEEHQIEISDKFLSWGWRNSKNIKITPIGNFILRKKPSYNKKGTGLVVLSNFPRFSNHIFACPQSSQQEGYNQDQYALINSLSEKIRKNITIRLYFHDYGWNQKERLIDNCPDIKIQDASVKIKYAISKSRIYISTYNATTYLESMSWNVPTLIFWNADHWELNDKTRPYIDLLRSVGIFHDTPLSLSNKLEEIWDDIDLWWQSDLVQNARIKFCNEFSLYNKKTHYNLFKFFKDYK